MGRDQPAGLYYLACPQIQNIKDSLATLYIKQAWDCEHTRHVHGGQCCVLWARGQGNQGQAEGPALQQVWSQVGDEDMQHSVVAKTGLFST